MALSVPEGDQLFDVLVEAYDAEPEPDRTALLARLCLVLAQRIGNLDAVRDAVREAKLAAT